MKGKSKCDKKKNKKVGRPSIYRKVLCKRIIEYFDQKPYEDIKLPHYKQGKDGERIVAWEDIKRMPRPLPTLRGFAKKEGISYVSIYGWVDKDGPRFKEEFFNAFICAKNLQKDILIQNGLQGLYNPAFAVFTAKNISDMRDVSRHEHTGKDGGPIQQKQIPALDLSSLDDDELALAEKLGLKAKENGSDGGT